MTRKDYTLIAQAIAATQQRIKQQASNRDLTDLLTGVRQTSAHLADALREDNPRFDAQRFLAACGCGSATA